MKAAMVVLLALASSGARAEEAANDEQSKSYVIPALEIVAFDALLNQFDRHYYGCCDFDSNIHTIRRNLRSSWVTDRDPFLVNQVGHPYQGAMYHKIARSAGFVRRSAGSAARRSCGPGCARAASVARRSCRR